jgi:hypothetical protein
MLLPLGGEDVGVTGVLVAPSQVGVQGPGLDRVVAVVGVGDGELPERSEVLTPHRVSSPTEWQPWKYRTPWVRW